MKNSSNIIRNRTREFPACSALPQLRHRVPPISVVQTNKYGDGSNKRTLKMDRITSEYYILSRADVLYAN
jgi:hypothetical protein